MDCLHWIVQKVEVYHESLKIFFGIIAGVFAYRQYKKNSKEQRNNYVFTRIANLSSIWRRFYETEEFMKIFIAFEEADAGNDIKIETLKNIAPKEKFKMLAYLAEVYSFSEVATIDKEKAIRLFQWHFYYIYINPATKFAFWHNLVEHNNDLDLKVTIEKEIRKPYWIKYFFFAQEAEKQMREEDSFL